MEPIFETRSVSLPNLVPLHPPALTKHCPPPHNFLIPFQVLPFTIYLTTKMNSQNPKYNYKTKKIHWLLPISSSQGEKKNYCIMFANFQGINISSMADLSYQLYAIVSLSAKLERDAHNQMSQANTRQISSPSPSPRTSAFHKALWNKRG